MFEWKDEYSCNIADIDVQHRKLFELGGQLFDVISLRGDFDHYDQIIDVLHELKDYTIYHFGFEEEMMAKYGYEDLENHKKGHKAFIDRMNQVDYKEIDEEQEKVTMDMIVFIANWIENHIIKTDSRYAKLLNAKGVY